MVENQDFDIIYKAVAGISEWIESDRRVLNRLCIRDSFIAVLRFFCGFSLNPLMDFNIFVDDVVSKPFFLQTTSCLSLICLNVWVW